MNIAAGDISGKALNPNQQARRIAERLEKMGFDPYQSDLSRFLVLLGGAPGEIIELGRPLRGSRLFKPVALRRDIPMVAAFKCFSEDSGFSDFLFWNVGLTGAKSELGHLCEDVKEFNRVLNIQFSELRKRCGFECLFLAIHPRFDHVSNRFDVHAHFICRIPEAHRESARRRLMQAFSKVDLPGEPIRNMPACATYMLWGIYPMDQIEALPDVALADLWALSRSKARLVRSGGSFAKFRRSVATDPATSEERARKARIQANRAETSDPRPRPEWTDRLLTKLVVKRDGASVPALLFEETPKAVTSPSMTEGEPEQDSSSATCITTQEPMESSRGMLTEIEYVPRAASPAGSGKNTLWIRFLYKVRNVVREGFSAVRTSVKSATAPISSWFVRFMPGDAPPELSAFHQDAVNRPGRHADRESGVKHRVPRTGRQP